MNRGRLNLITSLLIGVGVFVFFLERAGINEIGSIFLNLNPFYLAVYCVVTTLAFFPTAWRWQVILKAHNKKVPFLSVLKYTIAGYAVSYITPVANAGGEPVRAYMLKKESNVDLKTGSSSIIIDKFVELLGTAVFGMVGLFFFVSMTQLSGMFKIIIGILLGFTFFVLFTLYYRTITGRGSFSSLFTYLRLHKIFKLKNFAHILEKVEKKMEVFFLEHKKEFLLSCLFYILYGITAIFEFKFLLLALGIDASIEIIIMSITFFGIANFVPVPAAVGFLEAGQTTLFSLVKNDAGAGFALSLVMRARALIFVAVGFGIISYFSGKQLEKVYRKALK